MTRKIPVLLSILFICIWLFSVIIGCSGGNSGGGESGGSPVPSPSVSPSTGWVVNVTGVDTPLNNSSFISEIMGWVVGDNGVILKTIDNGDTWIAMNSGITKNLYGVCFLNTTEGIAVGADGTVIRTINGGTDWDENVSITPQTGNTLRAVEFKDNTGWIVGDGGVIYKSSDRGVTWSLINSGISANLLDLSFINSQSGWICGNGGIILHTGDGGTTWTAQTSGVAVNLHGISFVNSISGWAAGDSGTIISTNDGGNNWTSEISGVTTNLKDICFVDVNHGWAVGDNGLILNKGGALSASWITGNYPKAAWYQQSSNTTSNLIKLIFINTNVGYIVGENGLILITTNGGNDPNNPSPTETPTSTPTDTPTTTPTSTPTDTPYPPNPQKKSWQGAVPIDGRGSGAESLSGSSRNKLTSSKIQSRKISERNVDITAFPDNSAIAVFTFDQGLTDTKGFGDAIFANRFTSSAWGEPVKISVEPNPQTKNTKQLASIASVPRIAGNASGKAMAVWVQDDGSMNRIYARHWNGSSWEGAQIIDAAVERTASFENASTPEIAYSDNGTATAVFIQINDGMRRVYANHWNGSGWTGAVLIDYGPRNQERAEILTDIPTSTPTPSPSISPTPFNGFTPQVVMTSNGLVAAVFTENTGARDIVFINAGSGESWGTAIPIDNPSGEDSYYPQITLDRNLNANVIFAQLMPVLGESTCKIYSTYYNGVSWSTPAAISSSTGGNCDFPHLAVNYTGQNLAVFQQTENFLWRGISNFASGGNYSDAIAFDDANNGETYNPRVAFDKYSDEALVTFLQGSEEDSRGLPLIYANTWKNSAWATQEKINFGNYGVEADVAWGNGQAFVIMRERINFEEERIFANWYK